MKSSPNQVYVLSGLSSSNSPPVIPLLISGATAAAFSPDGLKAFIAAGNTLYVYSTVQALKTVALSVPATAISFYANGALAYLAGGASDAVTMRNACDTTYAQAAIFPGRNPVLFQAVPDGIHALGVESPGVDVFTVQVNAPPVAPAQLPALEEVTCPFPVATADSSFVNLGQGTFTPLKLLIAPDNSKAYVLASNLGSVFVLDLGVNTVSSIPLTGNPVPLDVSLTSDGTTLYVGTNDGSVHVVSTVSGGDLVQITFTGDNTGNKSSLCSNIPQTCNPDLVAVQP
jgi:WD40 repeat protein